MWFNRQPMIFLPINGRGNDEFFLTWSNSSGSEGQGTRLETSSFTIDSVKANLASLNSRFQNLLLSKLAPRYYWVHSVCPFLPSFLSATCTMHTFRILYNPFTLTSILAILLFTNARFSVKECLVMRIDEGFNLKNAL